MTPVKIRSSFSGDNFPMNSTDVARIVPLNTPLIVADLRVAGQELVKK